MLYLGHRSLLVTEFDNEAEENAVDIRIPNRLLPANAEHGTPTIRRVEIGIVHVKNR